MLCNVIFVRVVCTSLYKYHIAQHSQGIFTTHDDLLSKLTKQALLRSVLGVVTKSQLMRYNHQFHTFYSLNNYAVK